MTKNKTITDLIIAIVITFIFALILIRIDAFELFSEYAEVHEEYELDEYILILLVGVFTALWYSSRRFNEIKELKLIIEKTNTKLNQDNIKKDKLLLEKIKMASLGEMIENIAHQWRQPLSAISTAASGIKVKKEFNQLEENEVDETLDNILLNTQYLSKTIDNFRNYIKDIQSISIFNIDDTISNTLNIFKGNLKMSNITVILNLNININIESYPNELTQVLINIMNNSKDAFEIKKIKERYIFISTEKIDEKIQITIRDTAEGIPETILDKIFEPYFTTKHNFNGTGLSLYMSYKIVDERLKGLIFANNLAFKYQDKEYIGAEFIIEIPIIRD